MTYTKEQLCSFGNYLLKNYGVEKVDVTDISDVDLPDWSSAEQIEKEGEINQQMPFDFQMCEQGWLNLWGSSVIVKIVGIHYYGTKVKYDLETQAIDGKTIKLYNVFSRYVSRTHPDSWNK